MKVGNVLTQIQELPSEQTFGYGFNYAVWSANTTVTLANVPWGNDYRDIVRFDNQQGLDNYIDKLSGPTIRTNGVTYAAVGRPIRLSIPFERANTFNYLRAYNPAQPLANGGDTGRSYYYFVQQVNYIAPDVTEFIIQLDVWQSFGYGAQFGNCFIERGHIGVANENQFNDNGREFLTTPEGHDLGGEYQITEQWSRDIASARTTPGGDPHYSILVVSTVALDKPPGNVSNPALNSATGSKFENLPSGAEMYLFGGIDQFKAFMEKFADKPWITQGIISITAVPYWSNYGMSAVITSSVIDGIPIYKINKGSLKTVSTKMQTRWRDTVMNGMPARYGNLHKFKTYPYMVLEMTSYTGMPIVIKPESWSDPDATVVEVPHIAPPGARIMFYPKRYNAAQPGPDPTSDGNGLINDGGEFLDMATGITNFPTFATVNNGYQAFMAANAHGIAFQHQSADWAQSRATAGNQVAANQATSAIGTSQDVNRQGISAATQQTTLANETGAYRSMLGMGNSALGGVAGVAGGNPGAAVGALSGMAGAAVGNAIDVNQRNQGLGISNNLAAGTNRAVTGNMGYVRDTNKQYGDYVAQGDYQNAIAGITAKVQDARMIQPTTSGQVGGDAFTLATYKWGYDIKVKMLQLAAMTAIGEQWLRYGYSVLRWGKMPASFMVCEKFTYWKLQETYITHSSCPESFKQTLRGIFEKGVTVWKNPSDIGTIDIADNAPLAGVRL